MAQSRYPAGIAVTYPLNYVSPFLVSEFNGSPDAEATGQGLAIQGTDAKILAGRDDPNFKVKARMGSIYLRVGEGTEHQAYVKVDGNGTAYDGPEAWGWMPFSSATSEHTFGLSDDTVATNSANRYGNVLDDCSLIGGAISFVGYPTTGDAVFDILYSEDRGTTWTSIFVLGSTPLVNKPTIPQDVTETDPLQIDLDPDTFTPDLVIQAPAMLRIDTLSSGGATNINITLKVGFKSPSNQINNNGGNGAWMMPIA